MKGRERRWFHSVLCYEGGRGRRRESQPYTGERTTKLWDGRRRAGASALLVDFLRKVGQAEAAEYYIGMRRRWHRERQREEQIRAERKQEKKRRQRKENDSVCESPSS